MSASATSVTMIVDDSGTINNGNIIAIRIVVPRNIPRSHITTGSKCPVVVRRIVCSYSNGDTDTRTQWCPAKVITTTTPYYPCRGPIISRNPQPSIKGIVKPATIMKWSPPPLIIRIPHPFIIVGINPITVGCIRTEISSYSRTPSITVFWIIDPFSVRTQSIVEGLKAYTYAYPRLCFNGTCHQCTYQHQYS